MGGGRRHVTERGLWGRPGIAQIQSRVSTRSRTLGLAANGHFGIGDGSRRRPLGRDPPAIIKRPSPKVWPASAGSEKLNLSSTLGALYAGGMEKLEEQAAALDWSDCPLVEVVPGKVSGVPILKGTRVQADAIWENYESGSPLAEISENFHIPKETVRAVLRYAVKHKRPRP